MLSCLGVSSHWAVRIEYCTPNIQQSEQWRELKGQFDMLAKRSNFFKADLGLIPVYH